MGNPNGPSEQVAAQPKVSLDRVQEFMVFKPSGKTLEKMKQIHDRSKKMRRVEEASRKAEERALETMEIALGLRPPNEEAKGLSDEEQQTVEESFDELKKEGSDETDIEAVRDATMGSLRVQKFYKVHYEKWKLEYEKLCDKDPSFALKKTMHEYLKEQGILFIKASAKEIIRKSSEDFYKQKSGKDKDKVSKAELTDFDQKISTYVKINREKLTAYYSLEPAEQNKLFVAFRGVLVAAGLKVTEAEAKKFFEELIGHIEYEYLAISDYESTSDDMSDVAEMNLSDDEWNAVRKKALEKNAKGELKEYLQQQKSPTPDFGAPTPAPSDTLTESSYKSVTDVAHSSGVNLRAAPEKGNNVFYLDFPTIKDKKFAPLLKVVFPAGVTDINKARFYIEQPWADKDAQKAQPIDKATTLSYSAQEVPLAVNMMILDYLLNKGIPLKTSPTESIGPNDMLRDQDMIHMAERLFGFKLSEKRMLDEQFTLFKHFLTVLLRDDQKSSLQERIKQARLAVDNDALVPYVRKALKSEGSVVKTLDELIDEAKLDQQGKKKD
jgi:hypothetical protein